MSEAEYRVPAQDDWDASQAKGGEEKFYQEEFKIFTNAVFDIDKRIAQIFAFTVGAAVSLLTWVGKVIFDAGEMPIFLAYASLIPNIFLLSGFFYLIAQRRDIVGLAAYLHLLEARLNVVGFQTGLGVGPGSIRAAKVRGGESQDPIPYSLWAVSMISAALFVYAVDRSCASHWNILALALPWSLLAYGHWKWKTLISTLFPKLKVLWQDLEDQSRGASQKGQ